MSKFLKKTYYLSKTCSTLFLLPVKDYWSNYGLIIFLPPPFNCRNEKMQVQIFYIWSISLPMPLSNQNLISIGVKHKIKYINYICTIARGMYQCNSLDRSPTTT